MGIPLGVCAIAAVLGIWYFFKGRLRKERSQREELESRMAEKQELSAEKKEPMIGSEAQEIDSSRRQEMDGNGHSAHEVGTNSNRHEVM